MRWRAERKILTAALLSLALAVALAPASSAQLDQWGYWENGVTEPWWFSSEDFTKEDAVAAVARWKSAAAAERDAPGAERGGVYFSGGDTHGTYVRWSPRGGFIIVNVDKCQARVMGLTYGRVEVSQTLVQFFPEFSKTASGAHGHSHSSKPQQAALRFVPVAWRGERMLVGEAEMRDFGDYVAGLGKYNYGRGFLYLGYTAFLTQHGAVEDAQTGKTPPVGTSEETGQAATTPSVPPGYARFLKQPIEATIIATGRRQVRKDYSYENPDGSSAAYTRASLTPVTVNAGASHGLKKGMFLRVAEPSEGDEIRIIRVGRHTSNGLLIRSLDDGDAETFFDADTEQPRPHSRAAIGWKLTTSPF